MTVLEGIVVFSNVTKTDVYNGKDTGKYNLTLSMDSGASEELSKEGVRLKEYEGVMQRKFASKYPPEVFKADGSPLDLQGKEIPYGSKVRIVYSLGKPHPSWGTTVYLNKVKVLELAEVGAEANGSNGEF